MATQLGAISLAAGWRRQERLVALALLAPAVLYLFAMSVYPTIDIKAEPRETASLPDRKG